MYIYMYSNTSCICEHRNEHGSQHSSKIGCKSRNNASFRAPRHHRRRCHIHIYTHIYMYMCICTHKDDSIYRHTNASFRAPRHHRLRCHTHIYTHTCMYIYVYMYIYIYTCVYVYICVTIDSSVTYVHTYIYVHIYIYIHVHICIYIHICVIIDSGGIWLIYRSYVSVTWLTCLLPSAVIDPSVTSLFCRLNLGMRWLRFVGSFNS